MAKKTPPETVDLHGCQVVGFGMLWFPKPKTEADRVWHKCNPTILPQRDSVDGRLIWDGLSQWWRRWHDGRWEYQQAPETEQEYNDRSHW